MKYIYYCVDKIDLFTNFVLENANFVLRKQKFQWTIDVRQCNIEPTMCKAFVIQISSKSSIELLSLCFVGSNCEADSYQKLNTFEARYRKIIIKGVARNSWKNK